MEFLCLVHLDWLIRTRNVESLYTQVAVKMRVNKCLAMAGWRAGGGGNAKAVHSKSHCARMQRLQKGV